MPEFNDWLTAKGFDPSAISETQRQTLEAAWRAEHTEPVVKPVAKTGVTNSTTTLDDIVAAQRKENARVDEITRLAKRAIEANPANLDGCEAVSRTAIEQGWDVQKAELEFIRAARPNGTLTILSSGEPDVSGRVLEAAVCVAGNLPNLEKHYDARTLEAANKHFRGGVGLNDLVMMSARKNGFRSQSTSVKSNIHGVLRAAFGGGDPNGFHAGMAGPSTYSLPNILSNVANKFLRVGFEGVDSTWREFSSVRAVTDFKQTTTATLTGDLQYALVPRGGEIKHGSIGETTYTNQADTYGRLLGIDRRDLYNDDLGALTSAGRRIGRGGALGFNDKFWSVFLNNSTFFASGNANVSTGGGSALSLAGLTAADLVFRNQTDPDGKPLATNPTILLVPNALRITALNLMNSTTTVATTTANAPLPDQNAFAGAFKVVSSPYLSNASYTGYSAAAWYLLADPMDMPVVEAVFLNGQQTPTVETSELDWNTLGIAMRGYFDYGVALQEYRGGVRSNGS